MECASVKTTPATHKLKPENTVMAFRATKLDKRLYRWFCLANATIVPSFVPDSKNTRKPLI
jgi:hypothetical protein